MRRVEHRVPKLAVKVSLAFGLVLTGLAVPAASLSTNAVAAPVAVGDVGAETTSASAAMQQAQESGERVEDLAQRTETDQVFANPDGTWTDESAPEPVRTQNDDGTWSAIDTTFTKVPGGYAPASAIGDLTISDGGDKTFAQMSVDGKDLDWKWSGTLPEPTVEGNTATYANVAAGEDLVVTATPSGFRHDIVLRHAPTGPVSFDIPVATEGSKVSEDSDGDLAVKTTSGDELVTASQPVMYDATNDPAGQPAHQENIDTTVTKTSAGAVVTLDPAESFLNDPSTKYPVTIDPTWNATNPNDTWVYDTKPDAIHPYDDSLYAGTPDNGTTRYRSFVAFENGAWVNQSVTAATLTLRNYDSTTCSGAAVQVRKITGSWTPGSATWNNPPPTTATNAVNSSAAFGHSSSCAAADVSWNVTNFVQWWAANPTQNWGVRIAAATETGTGSYRAYRSAGWSYPSAIPRLSVTYNVKPTPSALTVSPCPSCDPLDMFTSSLQPTFTIKSADPDSSNLTYTWKVDRAESDVDAYTATTTAAPNVSTSITLPPGIAQDGVGLDVNVVVSDGYGAVDTGWTRIGVDANQQPLIPSSLGLSPCTNCSPLVSTSTTPTLYATVTDPDSDVLGAEFQVRRTDLTGSTTASDVLDAESGSVVSFPLPDGVLADGESYEFRAGAIDDSGTVWSGWTPFSVQVPNGVAAPADLALASCEGPCTDWISNVTTPSFSATNPASNPSGAITFEVSNGEGFVVSGQVAATSGATATWSVPPDQLGGGTEWSVRAAFVTGSITVWSAVIPFTVSADAPSAIAVPAAEVQADMPDTPGLYDPDADGPTETPAAVTAEYDQAEAQISAEESSAHYRQVAYNTDARRTVSLARQYAPIVYFHKDEDEMPLDASTFIEHSAFRYHHWGPCVHGIASQGNINAYKLGGNGVAPYEHAASAQLDLTYKCAYDVGPMMKSTDNVRPYSAQSPIPKGEGMYMNLDNRAKHGYGFQGDEDMYYHQYDLDINGSKPGGQRTRIVYWFHYGESTTLKFDHEGDWERIGIQFIKPSMTPEVVAFSQHEHGCTVPWRLVTTEREYHNTSRSSDSYRTVVLSAKNTHASYPAYGVGGKWHGTVTIDQLNDQGGQWLPNHLVKVDDQPWYGYGGGWGAVGSLPYGQSEKVTGPGGPSPYKYSSSFGDGRCKGY